MQLPSNVDTTLETTLDQTSNTIDTNADDSKLDDTACETNGEEDNDDDIDDGIDNSEIETSPIADHTETLVSTAKPETLQVVDGNGSAPLTPAAAPGVKAENKGDDKNISRSGRVIKRTKYLLDEIEESPVGPTIKRKRPLDSPATVQKRRKSDEGSGENGTKKSNCIFFLAHFIFSILFPPPPRARTIARLPTFTRNRKYAAQIRFGHKGESPAVIGRSSKMHNRTRRI